ncbi:hypothetical protein P0F65_00145 [Sphingomonas sp. I4]
MDRGQLPAQGILPGYSGKLNIGSNDGKAEYNALYFTAEKPFVTGSTWGFTATLTVQQAKSNVAQELQGDEFFNGPRVDAYGWNYVAGVEKWRFVGTGIAKGPWDTKISVTGTFSSGPSFGQVIFPAVKPENASAYGNFGGVFWPDQIVGYAAVDLRVSKNFKMPWGHDLEVNLAAFNLFDLGQPDLFGLGCGIGREPDQAGVRHHRRAALVPGRCAVQVLKVGHHASGLFIPPCKGGGPCAAWWRSVPLSIGRHPSVRPSACHLPAGRNEGAHAWGMPECQ